MSQELSQGALVALFSFGLLFGFAFGALYDVFRIRRRYFQKKNSKKLLTRLLQGFIIGIEDFIFFLMLACVSCVLFFVFSMGRVRLLLFVFEGLGFLVYRVTLGRLLMGISDVICKLVTMTLNAVKKYLILPVFEFVSRPFRAGIRVLRVRCDSRRKKRAELKKIQQAKKERNAFREKNKLRNKIQRKEMR